MEFTEVLLGACSSPTVMPATEPSPEAPRWTKWHETFRVIAYPAYLKRTIRIALIFGSIIFAINHLDEVVSGHATLSVWVKGGLTFLVPFCVSNLGVLVASRTRLDGDTAAGVRLDRSLE